MTEMFYLAKIFETFYVMRIYCYIMVVIDVDVTVEYKFYDFGPNSYQIYLSNQSICR